MIIEAICDTCGQTFNPSDVFDVQHGECGGFGAIQGVWGDYNGDAMSLDAFDMNAVCELVHRADVAAYVEHTGGGCATIYAGASRLDSHGDRRWAAVGGPGTFNHRDVDRHVGWFGDFYIGPDDDGDTMPFGVADLGAQTIRQLAALIVAQATQSDPTQALDADTIDALGLDSSGRGIVAQTARRIGSADESDD
jgi:hypothetical protein